MKKTQSAGGVVLNTRGQVLVVNQRGKSWSLPKGHIEEGEDVLAAARREIHEESGLNELLFVRLLGSYERPLIGREGGESHPSNALMEDGPASRKTGSQGGLEVKHLTFFLFKTTQEKLQPIDPDNPEARWVEPDDVSAMLTHPKDQDFFRQVLLELLR
jgi:ADP-ribose pyrophosphatase YjhB (NUDIX family)